MTKKLFRSLIWGMIVFATAILAGYLAYNITYRRQLEQVEESFMKEELVSAASMEGDLERDAGETLRVAYYLARLENKDIAIYMATEEGVKFLYRLDIYTGNFPAEELLRLKKGVILQNRQELAVFEEDYTS